MIIGNTPAAPSDLVRQIVNLAVNAGRIIQSSQTGFVHWYHRVLDYPTHDTIPIYENFLFVLALMRERTAESFAEGKALLEKLLHFQISDTGSSHAGNFPLYLHEYPDCKDRNVAANVLPIFYWILHTFPVVLGSPLRDTFHRATERLLDYCLRLRHERPHFTAALKMACAIRALAALWQRNDLQQIGDQWIDELLLQSQEPGFATWYIPADMGEALVALQMVYTDIRSSPWAHLWELAERFWHPRMATYVGPGYHDYQFREQPAVTLLDLIMGFHYGCYSYRALLNGPHLLAAALIHPTGEPPTPLTLPAAFDLSVAGRRATVRQEGSLAYSLLEKLQPDPTRDNAYSAFRLVWGDVNCAHTLVCQGGNVQSIAYQALEGGIDLIFTLPEEVPTEVRQRNREVSFFLDAHEDTQFVVGGHASATTFQMGEKVTIESAGMVITLCASLEEGTGHFFGHIAKGNRTSQKHTTGDGRFKAYDWQLFLRTVDRGPVCKIRASLRFSYGGTP